MRLRAQGAILLLLLAGSSLSAQQIRPPLPAIASANPASTGLLSQDDSLAILGAALESRGHRARKTDCSHLVQGIYERAGFPYAYASSRDLYAGVEQFHRMSRPQSGDLVVWPGHVGIVIDPRQHTFFSSLRSGLGVERWDTRYWKRRGQPRFYRYLRERLATTPVHREVAALKTTSGVDRTTGDSADFDPADGLEADTAKTSFASAASFPGLDLPRMQVVNSGQPTTDQVREALLRHLDATGGELRGQDLFKLSQPVIVLDDLWVRRIHLDGNQGWAEVQISEPASIAAGRGNLKKRSEKQRWPLSRRDSASWHVWLPQQTTFVFRSAAVRSLAHQLAVLSENPSPGGTDQRSEMARLLTFLLEK